MDAPREYELPGGITVTRTQPACGAVLSGIDLAAPIGEVQADSIRRALFAHGVIFFTGQQAMTFDDHLALAALFGTPIVDGPDPERPQITPVRAKAGSREGTASTWHSDGCYYAAPPAVSVLRAIDACTFGGDTCFSSATAAYAGLSDEMRARIEGLKFMSSLAARMPKDNASFGSADKWNELRDRFPPVHQPVAIVHPMTGARALYVNTTWSLEIVGMEDAEGQALIRELAAEFHKPEYQTRWQWQDGALAIWDNRLVQHYGVPDQQTDRYLERITLEGEPLLSVADWDARARVAA